MCTVLCSCAVLHAVRSSHRLAQRGAHAACESVIMKRAVVSLRRRDHVMRRRATPTRMADRDLHRELRRSIIMAKSNRLIAIGIQSSCSEGATGTCSVTKLGTPAMLSSAVCLRIAC